jgi:hypothetical protein
VTARLLTGVPVALVVAVALGAAFVGLERAHVGGVERHRPRWAALVIGSTTAVVAIAVARFVALA